ELRSGIWVAEQYAVVYSLHFNAEICKARIIQALVLLYGEYRRAYILVVGGAYTLNSAVVSFPERIKLTCRIQITWTNECVLTYSKKSTSFIFDLLKFRSDIAGLFSNIALTKHCTQLNCVT